LNKIERFSKVAQLEIRFSIVKAPQTNSSADETNIPLWQTGEELKILITFKLNSLDCQERLLQHGYFRRDTKMILISDKILKQF